MLDNRVIDNMEDGTLIKALVTRLIKEFPDLDLVLVNRPVGQRYAGLDAIPYQSYDIETWIKDFKNLVDTTKPVYLWSVEHCPSRYLNSVLVVYANMTLVKEEVIW